MIPVKKVDLDDIVRDSGLDAINELSSWDDTGAALRSFVEATIDLDELDRAQARKEAIAQLKMQKVDGAARLVDAAFTAYANSRRQALIASADCRDSWPSPVSTSELLVELSTAIRSYVILSEQEAVAVSLWVMAAHVFDSESWPWEYLPILSITSPEKRCGKSLLLDVLCALLSKAILTGNISAAALFRLIDDRHPVVLVDEYDSVTDEMKEALRNVLNSAFQRGRPAYRCVGQGTDLTVEEFDVFGPVCVAGIGRLPNTVADRAVPISLKRKAPTERVERFNRDARIRLSTLQKKAFRWAHDTKNRLRTLDESVPEDGLPKSLSDRATDIWRPLVCIARDGDNDCLNAAIRATALSADPDSAVESARVELLRAIKGLFDERDTDRLSSATIVEALSSDETGRWAEYSRGKPITPRQVARLLAPLSIKPVNLWCSSGAVKKGYKRDDLSDAWSRYLVLEFESSARSLDNGNSTEIQQYSSAREGNNLADRSARCSDSLAERKSQKQLTIDESSGLAEKTGQNTEEKSTDSPPEGHPNFELGNYADDGINKSELTADWEVVS